MSPGMTSTRSDGARARGSDVAPDDTLYALTLLDRR